MLSWQYVRTSGYPPAAGATKQRPNPYVAQFQAAAGGTAGPAAAAGGFGAAAAGGGGKPLFGKAAQQEQQQQGFGSAGA